MPHDFQFFRAGGVEQVHFDSGADLVHLGELDHKLWVALACPTKGLALDPRTVALLDGDHDGRIRANDVAAAASWLKVTLARYDTVLEGKQDLPLDAIADTAEGGLLRATARSVLEAGGKGTLNSITVEDITAALKAFDSRPFNGDGSVPPKSIADESVRALAQEVIACTGGTPDRGGDQGFSAANLDTFFAAVAARAQWLSEANEATHFLGDGTGIAREALEAVRAKVDDYFTRCRLVAFDSRAAGALNRDEKDYATFAARTLNSSLEDIAAFPLARVGPGQALPLGSPAVNPAWSERMAQFNRKVVQAIAPTATELTAQAWAQVCEAFREYDLWNAKKVGAELERLGQARVLALAKPGARTPLDELLAREKKEEPIAASLATVEKLALLHRDLHRVATNFVNFRDFYARKWASFQVGTLFLDQRACELCLRVDDAGRHAPMASLSRAFLAYCDLTRASGEKMSIVAALTAGDGDNLMVGRNGIFVDRENRDWDATITKLVENPISIRQAFWSPYKKLVRFVEEQVAKRAADADKQANDSLTTGASDVGKAADTGKPAEPKKLDVGVVAALGVAVGGITAALGGLLQGFFGLGMYMPIGLVGLLLLISGPSMLIAWLKLRQRNIGPLLDASGWAVNSKALLNVPLGASLTNVAQVPRGARVDRRDPFQEKPSRWGLWVSLALVVALASAYLTHRLDGLLPAQFRRAAPADTVAPAATNPSPSP